jgi:hypothetical protein
MLDVVVKEKLSDYLKASVDSTSVTYFGEPVLKVQLAPNASYYIDLIGTTKSNGDSLYIQTTFTGTIDVYSLLLEFGAGTLQTAVVGTEYLSTVVNEVFHLRGFLRTGNGGTLGLNFRKQVDFSGDTTLQSGAVLTARRI